MAVTKMNLISVVGDISKLEDALNLCAAGGEFHIEQASAFLHGSSDFLPVNDENPYSSPLENLSQAIDSAGFEAPESADKNLAGTLDEMSAYAQELSAQITQRSTAKANLAAQLEERERALEQLGHYAGLDIKFSDIFACEYISVRFGRLPRESYDKLKYYSDNPYIVCIPCTSDKKYVWGLYCAPIDEIAEVDRIFSGLYWERMWMPDTSETPEEACETLRGEIEQLRAELEEADKTLSQYWNEHKTHAAQTLTWLSLHKENFDLRRYAVRYADSNDFYFVGWLPKGREKKLCRQMEELGVECTTQSAAEASEHTPPVKLKNAKVFRPFEFFVKMYGLPAYNEPDPTPFVAITYFLLFGIMFGDLGQGFFLSIIAWFFMWKMKGMELGRPIALCGISSMFFGVIFGSVFGFEEWLNPFWAWVSGKTGIPLTNGKLFDVHHSQTTLIYFSVAIGVVLVICAMCLGVYSKLRQKQWGQALFGPNGLAGLVFYTAIAVGLGGQLLLGLEIMSIGYILGLIVLPLILIFLQEPLSELLAGKSDWLPEKPVDFIMQNFFELIEVLLSYVSNTVSFLRVGAFVLVHAGMMTVVFTLAEMAASQVVYIIIVVIGNFIIMALEALLVGIQTLRLEFYEMFSRFFSGSGRVYSPIKLVANTKVGSDAKDMENRQV